MVIRAVARPPWKRHFCYALPRLDLLVVKASGWKCACVARKAHQVGRMICLDSVLASALGLSCLLSVASPAET